MTPQERTAAAQRFRLDGHERRVIADIELLYRETYELFGVDIQLVSDHARDARIRGEVIDGPWLTRQPVYQRLLRRVGEAFGGFRDNAIRVLQAGILTFAQQARLDVIAQLMQLGMPTVAVPQLNAAVPPVARIVPPDDLLASLDKTRALIIEGVEQHVGQIIVDGRSLTVPALRQAVLDEATTARLRTIVRTETMRGYRETTRERHLAMGEVLQGVQWIATLSPRTCLACLSRHGRVYPVGYVMESHPNCRCSLAPLAQTTSPEVPQTGEDYFRSLPADVQRRRLGQAYDAYADGRLVLDDFTGTRRSRRYGPSVYQRSAREALRRTG